MTFEEARLKLNSTNSSKPPRPIRSGWRRKLPRPLPAEERGRPARHRKARRTLVLPEQVHQTFDCADGPAAVAGAFEGEDPEPRIHQVAELLSVEPVVDEYRLHRLTCSGCGATTCGRAARGRPHRVLRPAPPGRAGDARGAYRLSKRQIQQLAADLFALSIATGMISKLERSAAVLEALYNELAIAVHHAKAMNIDETSRASGPARSGCGRWSPHSSRSSPSPRAAAATSLALLGSEDDQVAGSDRFVLPTTGSPSAMPGLLPHLRRDFQAMIDRGGEGEAIGRRLLSLSNRLFRHWHRAATGPCHGARSKSGWACALEAGGREHALEDGSRCAWRRRRL
ncbi:MAG: hypothetical protein U0790_05185 [Isosphaeraceae bacterium]